MTEQEQYERFESKAMELHPNADDSLRNAILDSAADDDEIGFFTIRALRRGLPW